MIRPSRVPIAWIRASDPSREIWARSSPLRRSRFPACWTERPMAALSLSRATCMVTSPSRRQAISPIQRRPRVRRASADAERQLGRADATPRAVGEEPLDAPVLERVERDRAEPAPLVQYRPGERQRPLDLVELVVDRDAQGLEGALGRVASREARRCGHGPLDHLDELLRGVQVARFASADDRAGDGVGEALLAVL